MPAELLTKRRTAGRRDPGIVQNPVRFSAQIRNQKAFPRVSGTPMPHRPCLRLRAEVVFTSADSRRTELASVGPPAVDSEVCELKEVSADRQAFFRLRRTASVRLETRVKAAGRGS